MTLSPAALAYLDELGLGSGPARLRPIGEGHSNLTYLVTRGDAEFVLRRPPAGDIAASANDVVREARVLEALAGSALRVPAVIAICEDASLLGAPFFLAEFVAGAALVSATPAGWGEREARWAADGALDALLDLHSLDLAATGLDAFGRPNGYLERQLKRFTGLLETNATRPLPDLERVATWLADNRPDSQATTFVHGDFRLGNLLFDERADVAAVLDWEMSTTGDPLADLGYLTATWAQPGEPRNPMTDLSAVTERPGFPTRDELARRYAERSSISLDSLPWYQVLALWKAAIFLEGSFRRHQAGKSDDPYFAGLETGVPVLAAAALRGTRRSLT